MSKNGLAPDLAHALRFAKLLGRAVPHAASLEEALAAVDLALAEPSASSTLPPDKVDVALSFDAFHRKAQGVLNRAVKAMKALSGSARNELRQALSKKTVAEVGQALVAFISKYRLRLASLLSATQLAALLEGAREVAAKLPPLLPQGTAATAPPGLPPEEAAEMLRGLNVPPPEPPQLVRGDQLMPPGDPGRVQLPLIEEAARLLQEKNLVSREVFDRLDAASRQKAFTVAGVSARETLEKIRGALAEVVEEGADLDAFREKVLAEVEPGTFLSEPHMETVFRTAVQGAFSDGQLGILRHPVVRSGFPYATYDPIHDDRVREDHLALEKHGIQGTAVYRTDDPVFETFRPPWDYNCRCSWTPLTIRDAAAKGVKEARDWLDTGVEPSPPAFVPMPPFRPPAGFVRPVAASLAVAEEPLEDFNDIIGPGAVTLFSPEPGPNQGAASVHEDFPEVKGKPKVRNPRRVRRKLARKLRVKRRWRKGTGAALGMVGDEWHGPTPPGEGWVQIQPGPRGGKRWRRGAGSAGTVLPAAGQPGAQPTGVVPQTGASRTASRPSPQAALAARMQSYAAGNAKVAFLAGLWDEAQRADAEANGLRDQLSRFWKDRGARGISLSPEDQEIEKKMTGSIGEADSKQYEAHQRAREALVKEFAAQKPLRLASNFDHTEALAPVHWGKAALSGIAEAQTFLSSVVEYAGDEMLATAIKPLSYTEGRAYYLDEDASIHLDAEATWQGTVSATAVHEWGHQLEYRLPGVKQACADFLAYRAKGEKERSFSEVMPEGNYQPSERGVQDEFGRAFGSRAWYVGKVYEDGATEILSMGLEKLYTDPAMFAKADPEYCKFVLGILDGSLRT